MQKAIPVKATAASHIEKWQGQKTRQDDHADELSESHHSIVLLQNKLNETYKDIEPLTPFPIKKVWAANNNRKGEREIFNNAVTKLVCEIILHYTPPYCISANILSQAQTTHPILTVVNHLPSINHI